MLLRHLQNSGHKPIVLLGGGTTKVGDPSGIDESRKLLSDEDIQNNKAKIKTTFERFLKFGSGPTDAILVDNSDWLESLKYISFLRDIGPHFTINRMMTFDSVKLRLEREQPLTFLEFNYMIMQAYDFMELSRRHNCTLQLGGSDQWGNIVNGMELARRIDGKSLFGLTTPLITNSGGGKMGKTAAGAVWLNEEQLSNYDYWQFWRNSQDTDVGKFLRLFTEVPIDEILKLEVLAGAEINDAKKILAFECTKMCRGVHAAKKASDTAHVTFVEKSASEDLPTLNLTSSQIKVGIGVLDIFVEVGLCNSKNEVRRLIQQGGAKIEGISIKNEDLILTIIDFKNTTHLKLSAGKKRHAILRKP